MICNELCEAVHATLDKGQKNAIHARELCDRFGLSSRELRLVMAELRGAGVCVISDEHGYYLPETAPEIRRFIKKTASTQRAHGVSIRTAISALNEMQRKDR